MPSPSPYRKTWNREEFRLLAQERIQRISLPPVEGRSKTGAEKIEIDKILGRSKQISSAKTSHKDLSAGFKCECCKYLAHDYNTYLDHVNSWRHRKAVGSQQEAVPVTVEGVRLLLEELRDQLAKKTLGVPLETPEAVSERISTRAAQKAAKKKCRKSKRRAAECAPVEESEQAKEMREAGFCFSDKK